MDFKLELVFDATMLKVALGAAILGSVSGALGAFAVLRKQSLLGDAISHAALPGIALAFLFTGSKTPIILMLGAAAAGWIGTYLVLCIIDYTRIKEDSSLGIILSVFFGFGLVLLAHIQNKPSAAKAGLDTFLFGQAATLMTEDIITMAILGTIVVAAMVLFWKEFKLMTFNAEFGEVQGFPRKSLDILLISLLVIAIVIGLQTVGVVLMSAMVVIPPASARQWTNRLSGMVVLSGLIGAGTGIVGSVLSGSMTKLPTGPAIVICMAGVMVFSLLFSPRRGMLWALIRRQRNRLRFHLDGILHDLFLLAEHHSDYRHSHSLQAVQSMHVNKEGVRRGLEVLRDRGWVEEPRPGEWRLTDSGYEQAKQIAGEEKTS